MGQRESAANLFCLLDQAVAEVVIAEEAQLGQPLERGQGKVKALVDEVTRMVELDFGGERAAHVFGHDGLRKLTTRSTRCARSGQAAGTKERQKWVWCWF